MHFLKLRLKSLDMMLGKIISPVDRTSWHGDKLLVCLHSHDSLLQRYCDSLGGMGVVTFQAVVA